MTSKSAVSLPDHLVEQARRPVALGQAPSVSAYVATAMGAHERRERLARELTLHGHCVLTSDSDDLRSVAPALPLIEI